MQDRRQVNREKGENVCRIFEIYLIFYCNFVQLANEYSIKFLETSAKGNIVSIIVNMFYRYG